MSRKLALQGRYYRTIPINNTAYETEPLELDCGKTALIAMHCWDIGCAGGPAIDVNYCVGMAFPGAFREADRIMRECILPAIDAARAAGVLVCHVENESIARKHPEACRDLDPPAEPPSSPGPVVPGWRMKMTDRFHGPDYAAKSPYGRMDRAKIVTPLADEPYVFQTGQLDRALRRHGIENLIYAGFAADMCVLRAPGGIEPMAGFEYRLFLMRDATVGIECPDIFEEHIATRWAVRYFETHFGDTILLADFLNACKECK